MARAITTQRKAINTVFAWSIGILIFFPILWTVLTSFKTEAVAIANPPVFLGFDWTLENYCLVGLFPEATPQTETIRGLDAGSAEAVRQINVLNGNGEPVMEGGWLRGLLCDPDTPNRSNYTRFLTNSIIIAGGSTILGLLIAIPAAWSMAFVPSRRTKDILLWMLSTKMLPAVGVLYPIYLLCIRLGVLDSRAAMVFILMLINLPIIIWMLYTYFKEIPVDILEAARMDGASLKDELLFVLTPMAIPGIASTMLLNFILAWNEAFWTLNLTSVDAAPLTAFIASYSSPEGLFFAKLSAASTMAIAPILILGWFSQKQLVRGLTFGAVK
jgi:sorbitol/mannitol transport system permease protein